MFYLKKRRKQMIALCLSAALSVGSLTAYAATEYWNDASTKPMVETKTPISDNTNWEQWKAGWDNLKTNYEQVALTPGADFSKLNFLVFPAPNKLTAIPFSILFSLKNFSILSSASSSIGIS